MDIHQRKLIKDFLVGHMVGVIATVGPGGRPEAAVIGFTEDDTLQIFFGTSNKSRKYENLLANSSVAFAIGGQEPMTIQYEGRAQLLDGDEEARAKQLHIVKHPSAAKFVDLPDEVYFKVVPTWIRYYNLKNEAESFEVTF